MRIYFLHDGLPERLGAADPSARPRSDYRIQTDGGENRQVGTGLARYLGQHILAALERDDTAYFIRPLDYRLEDAAPGQLGP